MTDEHDPDPNEAYDVVPIPPGELMHSHGWYSCKQNGIKRWHGPKEIMEQLAKDPEERALRRQSKKHHDKVGTPWKP